MYLQAKTSARRLPWSLKLLFFGVLVLFLAPQAHAAEYTVCSSGCDFPTLTAALQAPGLGTTPDGLTLDPTYVFDDGGETTPLTIPDNVSITCAPGAGTLGAQASPQWDFYGGSNVTWQQCTFENLSWDFTGDNNVHFLNNTYTDNPSGMFTMTFATNVTISGNTNMQEESRCKQPMMW